MKRIAAGILLAVLMLLCTTALGLAFIHISGFPYSVDIGKLNISKTSGFSKEEIIINYDAAMHYLSPFSSARFTLPTLKYSKSGSYHFAQCKSVFNTIYLLGAISTLSLTIIMTKKPFSKITLRISGIVTILIPTIMSCMFAINFEKAFTLFHRIFFPGTSWLFNPQTDEIINILPIRFFTHCACVIAAFWILGAASLITLGISKTSLKR